MAFAGFTGTSGTGFSGSGNTGSASQQPAGGGSNTNAKPTGSIFGSTNTGGNLFGNASNTSSTTSGSSLFGANPNPSTNAGGGLFGGGNTSSTHTTGNGRLGGPFSNPSSNLAGGLFGAPQSTGTTTSSSASNTFNNTSSSSAQNSASGGLFGTTTTPAASSDAAKTSTATNPLFGASSAFSSLKPPDTAAKPPASNFFSLGNTLGTTPAVGTTGLFNLPKPATTAGTSNTPATNTSGGSTSSNLFGGGGLFGNPPASSANTATTGTSSLFSLGGEKKDAPTTSTSLGGGLFGAPKTDEAKKDGSLAASQPFGLFGATTSKQDEKKDSSAALTLITTKDGEKKDTPALTGLSVAVAPPSMLRGKTLEEIINKWTADLEANVREFNRFGAEVAVWDRALIENGNNIAALYSHVLAAEKQQNEINDSLNHIEQQQRDLASTLDAYEKISQEILGGQGSTLRTLDAGPADNERDKNYMLATDLHTHLDDLSGSLTQMIESVNALSISSKSEDSTNDPMAQITQILSSHLESLQWIDSAVREVESKASEVEKRVNLSGHGSGLKSRGNRT